jgi:hypothetical protein
MHDGKAVDVTEEEDEDDDDKPITLKLLYQSVLRVHIFILIP